MKSFYLILAVLCISISHARALSVSDVRVSVTADSAAAAREQAIEKAHELAFEKLVKENFPDQVASLPSPDKLMNMVTNFSIDKEKTSPKKYAASMTFQFDGGQVQSWLKKASKSSEPSLPISTYREEIIQIHPQIEHGSAPVQQNGPAPLKVTATYNSLPEWQHIKRTLEDAQGMINVSVTNLSAQRASVDLEYGGNIDRLHQQLLSQGLTLAPEGDSWIITSNNTLR